MLADAFWPAFDPELVREETVMIAMQVGGKMRASLELARDLDRPRLEEAALGNDLVQRAIAGHAVRKIVVVPNRIVNGVV